MVAGGMLAGCCEGCRLEVKRDAGDASGPTLYMIDYYGVVFRCAISEA